jgi:hypothetical protein
LDGGATLVVGTALIMVPGGIGRQVDTAFGKIGFVDGSNKHRWTKHKFKLLGVCGGVMLMIVKDGSNQRGSAIVDMLDIKCINVGNKTVPEFKGISDRRKYFFVLNKKEK